MKFNLATFRNAAILGIACIAAMHMGAQPRVIRLTDQYTGFEWNEMLPAGKSFHISGKLPPGIAAVSVSIYPGGTMNSASPLYTSEWVRHHKKSANEFHIAVHYPLTISTEYDLKFTFFRHPEVSVLDEMLTEAKGKIKEYVKTAAQACKYTPPHGGLKPASKRVQELNEIFVESISGIKDVQAGDFHGYSSHVHREFHHLNFFSRLYQEQLGYGDLFKTLVEQSELILEDHIRYLNELIINESEHFLWRKLMVADKSTSITKQKAADFIVEDGMPKPKIPKGEKIQKEKIENPWKIITPPPPIPAGAHPYWHGISLTPGLSSVMLSKFSDGRQNASFGSGSFIGLSFPLSHHARGSHFLTNSSATFGAFFANLTDEDKNVYSGSVFPSPAYVAYGYRMLKIMRFHIGIGALKTPGSLAEKSKMIIRPMGGISLDLNYELLEKIRGDF